MIIKIEGTSPIRSAQPIKRAVKSTAAGEGFAKQLDEASAGSAVSETAPLGVVSGILGLQEVDDATERAARNKKRADGILDQLEDLRMDLLAGSISREKLMNLVKMVNTRRLEIKDPRLSQILDEIDLRAQVELAKYTST